MLPSMAKGTLHTCYIKDIEMGRLSWISGWGDHVITRVLSRRRQECHLDKIGNVAMEPQGEPGVRFETMSQGFGQPREAEKNKEWILL